MTDGGSGSGSSSSPALHITSPRRTNSSADEPERRSFFGTLRDKLRHKEKDATHKVREQAKQEDRPFDEACKSFFEMESAMLKLADHLEKHVHALQEGVLLQQLVAQDMHFFYGARGGYFAKHAEEYRARCTEHLKSLTLTVFAQLGAHALQPLRAHLAAIPDIKELISLRHKRRAELDAYAHKVAALRKSLGADAAPPLPAVPGSADGVESTVAWSASAQSTRLAKKQVKLAALTRAFQSMHASLLSSLVTYVSAKDSLLNHIVAHYFSGVSDYHAGNLKLHGEMRPFVKRLTSTSAAHDAQAHAQHLRNNSVGVAAIQQIQLLSSATPSPTNSRPADAASATESLSPLNSSSSPDPSQQLLQSFTQLRAAALDFEVATTRHGRRSVFSNTAANGAGAPAGASPLQRQKRMSQLHPAKAADSTAASASASAAASSSSAAAASASSHLSRGSHSWLSSSSTPPPPRPSHHSGCGGGGGSVGGGGSTLVMLYNNPPFIASTPFAERHAYFHPANSRRVVVPAAIETTTQALSAAAAVLAEHHGLTAEVRERERPWPSSTGTGSGAGAGAGAVAGTVPRSSSVCIPPSSTEGVGGAGRKRPTTQRINSLDTKSHHYIFTGAHAEEPQQHQQQGHAAPAVKIVSTAEFLQQHRADNLKAVAASVAAAQQLAASTAPNAPSSRRSSVTAPPASSAAAASSATDATKRAMSPFTAASAARSAAASPTLGGSGGVPPPPSEPRPQSPASLSSDDEDDEDVPPPPPPPAASADADWDTDDFNTSDEDEDDDEPHSAASHRAVSSPPPPHAATTTATPARASVVSPATTASPQPQSSPAPAGAGTGAASPAPTPAATAAHLSPSPHPHVSSPLISARAAMFEPPAVQLSPVLAAVPAPAPAPTQVPQAATASAALPATTPAATAPAAAAVAVGTCPSSGSVSDGAAGGAAGGGGMFRLRPVNKPILTGKFAALTDKFGGPGAAAGSARSSISSPAPPASAAESTPPAAAVAPAATATAAAAAPAIAAPVARSPQLVAIAAPTATVTAAPGAQASSTVQTQAPTTKRDSFSMTLAALQAHVDATAAEQREAAQISASRRSSVTNPAPGSSPTATVASTAAASACPPAAAASASASASPAATASPLSSASVSPAPAAATVATTATAATVSSRAPTSDVEVVVALYDYAAARPGLELSFRQGDMIRVLAVDPSGWWSGRLVGAPTAQGGGHSRTGLFPSNFCRPKA